MPSRRDASSSRLRDPRRADRAVLRSPAHRVRRGCCRWPSGRPCSRCASRAAIDDGVRAAVPLRPGLIAEMLAFYDTLQRHRNDRRLRAAGARTARAGRGERSRRRTPGPADALPRRGVSRVRGAPHRRRRRWTSTRCAAAAGRARPIVPGAMSCVAVGDRPSDPYGLFPRTGTCWRASRASSGSMSWSPTRRSPARSTSGSTTASGDRGGPRCEADAAPRSRRRSPVSGGDRLSHARRDREEEVAALRAGSRPRVRADAAPASIGPRSSCGSRCRTSTCARGAALRRHSRARCSTRCRWPPSRMRPRSTWCSRRQRRTSRAVPAIALLALAAFQLCRHGGPSPRGDDIAALDRALSEAGYLGDLDALDRLLADVGSEAGSRVRGRRAAGRRVLGAIVRQLSRPAGRRRPCRPPRPVARVSSPSTKRCRAPTIRCGRGSCGRAAAILGTLGALRDAYERFDAGAGRIRRRRRDGSPLDRMPDLCAAHGESGVHLVDADERTVRRLRRRSSWRGWSTANGPSGRGATSSIRPPSCASSAGPRRPICGSMARAPRFATCCGCPARGCRVDLRARSRRARRAVRRCSTS